MVERRCHDIYEAAMHQRSISETRAQEAADRVQSMRIVLEKREAQIVHLQAELQSTAAQKQMVIECLVRVRARVESLEASIVRAL